MSNDSDIVKPAEVVATARALTLGVNANATALTRPASTCVVVLKTYACPTYQPLPVEVQPNARRVTVRE